MTERAPRLLIAFDGSGEARRAIEVAGAHMPGARATVVTVHDAWNPLEHAAVARLALPDSIVVPAADKLTAALAEAAEATAARGEACARAAGLDADHHVEPASKPWRGLVAVAARFPADLLVCGARGHGGLSRALLGSTSGSLLHHAPVPLLIVPAASATTDGPLLVGYDGSEAASGAIRLAARLFAGTRATIVNVWSSPLDRSYEGEGMVAMPVADLQELVAGIESLCIEDAEQLAAEGAAAARELGLAARSTAVAAGLGISHALAAAAEDQDAAAIVVGSRGRGPIASTVLGSVSAALAHNATRPVLVVGRSRHDQAIRADEEAGSTATHPASSAIVSS